MDGRGEAQPGAGAGRPEFAPPSPTGPPTPVPAAQPPASPDRASRSPSGPARSRVPALVTAVAVGVVVAVVAAATLVAHHADTHIATSSPPRVVAPTPTQRSDRVPFQTSTGTGELVLLHRHWTSDGTTRQEHGAFLQVQVEITCETGTVSYDPFDFEAFDAAGELYDQLPTEADDPVLTSGVLEPGDHTEGSLAFDIPRGAVTLLMSEIGEQPVTALRVPD